MGAHTDGGFNLFVLWVFLLYFWRMWTLTFRFEISISQARACMAMAGAMARAARIHSSRHPQPR
jgi:hypothetical protein